MAGLGVARHRLHQGLPGTSGRARPPSPLTAHGDFSSESKALDRELPRLPRPRMCGPGCGVAAGRGLPSRTTGPGPPGGARHLGGLSGKERTGSKQEASRRMAPSSGGPRKADDADAAKARQLREKGIAATDIAKMLGVSRATAYRYLTEDGAA